MSVLLLVPCTAIRMECAIGLPNAAALCVAGPAGAECAAHSTPHPPPSLPSFLPRCREAQPGDAAAAAAASTAAAAAAATNPDGSSSASPSPLEVRSPLPASYQLPVRGIHTKALALRRNPCTVTDARTAS